MNLILATNSGHPGIDRWNGLVNQIAPMFNVPPNLVKAHMLYESGGDSTIVAALDGGCGLMQITENVQWPFPVEEGHYTAALKPTYNGVDILDPSTNIKVACRDFIRKNLDAFPGNLDAAIAAYNAGPGRVERFITRGQPLEEATYSPHYISNVRGAFIWLNSHQDAA